MEQDVRFGLEFRPVDITEKKTIWEDFFKFSWAKKIKNIDYTLGLGWGYLGEDYGNPFIRIDESFRERTLKSDTAGGEFNPGSYFSGPMGAFAGIEVYLPNFKGLRFKLEYDATNYDEEGFSDPSNPFFLFPAL